MSTQGILFLKAIIRGFEHKGYLNGNKYSFMPASIFFREFLISLSLASKYTNIWNIFQLLNQYVILSRKTFIWNWHGTANLGFGKRNVVIDQRTAGHFTYEQAGLQAGNPVAWYPVLLHLNRFQIRGKTLRPRVWRPKEHWRNVGITINTTVKCYTN